MKVKINSKGELDENGENEVILNGSFNGNKLGVKWDIYFEYKDSCEYETAKFKTVTMTVGRHNLLFLQFKEFRIKGDTQRMMRQRYGIALTDSQLDRVLEIIQEKA